jgi:hypothetical protein
MNPLTFTLRGVRESVVWAATESGTIRMILPLVYPAVRYRALRSHSIPGARRRTPPGTVSTVPDSRESMGSRSSWPRRATVRPASTPPGPLDTDPGTTA